MDFSSPVTLKPKPNPSWYRLPQHQGSWQRRTVQQMCTYAVWRLNEGRIARQESLRTVRVMMMTVRVMMMTVRVRLDVG